MKCPNCEVALMITERQGIEIDYCPQCRGIWLDRGELDRIIERSALVAAPARQQAQNPDFDSHRDRDHEHHHEEHGSHGRRRGGWLSDLFD